MKLVEIILAILGVLGVICLMVFGFNFLHCTPIKLLDLIPKIAVAPVTQVIAPGSVVEYGRNNVKIKPPKALPGKTQLPNKDIWHPVELKPFTNKDGTLIIPQSGFCFIVMVGGKYTLFTDPYWEAGARLFVAGQYGIEIGANEKDWSPKIDVRPFDSNILVGIGPDFSLISFQGFSVSAKFDLGLFQ